MRLRNKIYLRAIGKFRNRIDEGLSESGGIIQPSHIEYEQNSTQNCSEINPRGQLLLRQHKLSRVLPHHRLLVAVAAVSDGDEGAKFAGQVNLVARDEVESGLLVGFQKGGSFEGLAGG